MSTPISLVNNQIIIHCESGEMFIVHCVQNSNPLEQKYWKLNCHSYEDDKKIQHFSFKENLELAILNAIPICEEFLGNPWSSLTNWIDDAFPDTIREFFEDKKQNDNHTLEFLQRFLINQLLSLACDGSDISLQEIKNPVSL